MGRQRRRLDAFAQVEEDAGKIYDRELLRGLENGSTSSRQKTYLRRISWPARKEDQAALEQEIKELLTGLQFSDVSLCDQDQEKRTILVFARYPSPAPPEEADESAA